MDNRVRNFVALAAIGIALILGVLIGVTTGIADRILMQEHGLTESEAYRRIQLQSMNMRKTMKEVADAIILAKSV